MQFFNDELFARGKSYSAYQQYWTVNREHLSEALLRISGGMLPDNFFPPNIDPIYLHDARIHAAHMRPANVSLHLHADRAGALREISLHYAGVTKCTPIPDVLLADVSHSDLMCHEVTISDANRFNHKLLFASSDVLALDFATLSITLIDHPLARSAR